MGLLRIVALPLIVVAVVVGAFAVRALPTPRPDLGRDAVRIEPLPSPSKAPKPTQSPTQSPTQKPGGTASQVPPPYAGEPHDEDGEHPEDPNDDRDDIDDDRD